MFILESSGPDPWESNYTFEGELETYDQFAIDGTYFNYRDELYHIYSCWEHAYGQFLIVIPLLSLPASISLHCRGLARLPLHNSPIRPLDDNLLPHRATPPKRSHGVLGASPTGPLPQPRHQRRPRTADEPLHQPDFCRLLRSESVRLPLATFSSSPHSPVPSLTTRYSNTPFYCLGFLELTGTSPLRPQSWRKDRDGCVFHQNPEEGIYGTGHASFVRTLDGEERYMVYHALTEGDPERKYHSFHRGFGKVWRDTIC